MAEQIFETRFTATYEGGGAEKLAEVTGEVASVTEKATATVRDYTAAQAEAAAAEEKTAAAKAAFAKQQEELNSRTGTSGLATPLPDLREQSAELDKINAAETRRNELLGERRVIGEVMREQLEAEANGQMEKAAALEQELTVRTAAYRIAVSENVSTEEALTLAEQRVAAETIISEQAAAQKSLNAELVAQEETKLALATAEAAAAEASAAAQAKIGTAALRGGLRGLGAGLGRIGLGAAGGLAEAIPQILALVAAMEAVKFIREKWTQSEKEGEAQLKASAKEAENLQKAEWALADEGIKHANQFLDEHISYLKELQQAADHAHDAVSKLAATEAQIGKEKIDQQVTDGSMTKEDGMRANAELEYQAKATELTEQLAKKEEEIARLQKQANEAQENADSAQDRKMAAGPYSKEGQEAGMDQARFAEERLGLQTKIDSLQQDKDQLNAQIDLAAEHRETERTKADADDQKDLKGGDEAMAKQAMDEVLAMIKSGIEKAGQDQKTQKDFQKAGDDVQKAFDKARKDEEESEKAIAALKEKERKRLEKEENDDYQREHHRAKPAATNYTDAPENDALDGSSLKALQQHMAPAGHMADPGQMDSGAASKAGADANSAHQGIQQAATELGKVAPAVKSYTDEVKSHVSTLTSDLAKAQADIAALKNQVGNGRTSGA